MISSACAQVEARTHQAVAQGAMDASNLLKPMLGRGELRCIGATTLVRPRLCEGALCSNAGGVLPMPRVHIGGLRA